MRTWIFSTLMASSVVSIGNCAEQTDISQQLANHLCPKEIQRDGLISLSKSKSLAFTPHKDISSTALNFTTEDSVEMMSFVLAKATMAPSQSQFSKQDGRLVCRYEFRSALRAKLESKDTSTEKDKVHKFSIKTTLTPSLVIGAQAKGASPQKKGTLIELKGPTVDELFQAIGGKQDHEIPFMVSIAGKEWMNAHGWKGLSGEQLKAFSHSNISLNAPELRCTYTFRGFPSIEIVREVAIPSGHYGTEGSDSESFTDWSSSSKSESGTLPKPKSKPEAPQLIIRVG